MNAPKTNQKGFTIIEVVLVLAIAGLIFLVVFLALPALQRGQRDQQRKADVSRLVAQITAYQSNTQGQLPSAWGTGSTFYTNYLKSGGQKFADPTTGNDYTITAASSAPGTTPTLDAGEINIYTNTKCDPASATGLAANSGGRNYAVLVFQEQGGVYCSSN